MSQGLTYYHECPQTRALCDRFGWRLENLPVNAHLNLMITVSKALRDDCGIRDADGFLNFNDYTSQEAYRDAIVLLIRGKDKPTGSDLASILRGLAALLNG